MTSDMRCIQVYAGDCGFKYQIEDTGRRWGVIGGREGGGRTEGGGRRRGCRIQLHSVAWKAALIAS